ncbi:MAG: cell division topological specificity factor MinE [Lachnobacterium sp.]|nr:cell division topological specificity factor MinE [Lachnobacterium sp.]
MSRSRAEATGGIARERLKLMVESETMEHSPAMITRMKKEIADIIARYYEVSPDNYEIKVILKQNKKRA